MGEDSECAPRCSAHLQRNDYFYFAFGATAFAERSVAMKAPVGLLSGRAVCVSRWRGFAPTSSAGRDKRYFHGRGCGGKRQVQRRFLRKHGAAGDTPSVKACGFATFPKGTAFVVAGSFAAAPKGVPLGELAANAVSRLRGCPGRGLNPLRHGLRRATSPERGRFCSTYRKLPKSSPFGGAGIERSEMTERVQPSPWGRWLRPTGADGRGHFSVTLPYKTAKHPLKM